jgi:adenine specific DNA methylase Mod
MHERSEQRFYSKLKDTFVGEKIKGDSGYVNLMNLRQKYFERIEPHIKESVNEKIKTDGAREELYDKLYTFFDAYLNETGTVFFANTQIHKNLYERVYSDRDDVSLFWKTKNLYYVKSEALYDDLETEIDGTTFKFDASAIKHAKGNEKKQLEFYLARIEENELTFKPKYQEHNSYNHFRSHFDKGASSNDIKNFIYENFPNIDHPNAKVISNNLDHTVFNKTEFTSIITVYDINDAVNTAGIEFAPYKVEHILKYFQEKDIPVNEDQLRKAFHIYKKQNEVDYFIHKAAKGFLTEQFNIYLYNYLFDDKDTEFTEKRVKQIQTIKEIAGEVIDYIACFEDELKAIWNKPKFVRNSNYVFTLDRLSDNVDLIEKIIEHPGFEKQIMEYKHLQEEWKDDEGNITKKEWKEFEKGANCSKGNILIEQNGKKILNPDFQFLPIDTMHFGNLKWEILDVIDHLEDHINGYLIKSDNYQALNTIMPKHKGEIDLIYIDPPFNTGEDFLYKDKFQDSTWLTLMHDRIIMSKELLKPTGSMFLHLDEDANYYGRILLNNIFGKSKEYYKNEIIWNYRRWNIASDKFNSNHDTIFWYTKSKNHFWNQLYEPKSEKSSAQGLAWTSVVDEETGRRKSVITGEKTKGVPMRDVWDISIINPVSNERLGFGTQKPEKLVKRIFDGTLDEEAMVLDFFVGSGTTISTAHKMGYKWIGVDLGDHIWDTALPRMKWVLAGNKVGISDEINDNWSGGGFFKYYELEQYEETLSCSKYSDKDLKISEYNFGADQKQLEAIEIDYENEKATIHFEGLYEDVDIAETLSNLNGKRIRKLNEKRVIFEDGKEIVFDEMTFGDYPWIKPLIWWNSRKANHNESES